MGGTGKTPLVIWLVEGLRELGFKVAVVTRGYGRSHSRRVTNDILRVDADAGPRKWAMRRCCSAAARSVPVYVCRDRVGRRPGGAGRRGAGVIVADDGLQHLRLARDARSCSSMPCAAGAMARCCRRAHCASIRRAPPGRTAMVLTGEGDAAVAPAGIAKRPHAACGQRALAGARRAATGAHSPHWPVSACTRWPGSAIRQRFFEMLRQARLAPIEHPLPDHHRYQAHELQFGDGLPVLMTEKDAVKCQAFAPENCWFLPVSARLLRPRRGARCWGEF